MERDRGRQLLEMKRHDISTGGHVYFGQANSMQPSDDVAVRFFTPASLKRLLVTALPGPVP